MRVVIWTVGVRVCLAHLVHIPTSLEGENTCVVLVRFMFLAHTPDLAGSLVLHIPCLAKGVDQIWMTCGESTNSKSRETTCFPCIGCKRTSLSEEQSRRGPPVMVRRSYESKERAWYILGIVLQIWKATFSSQKIVEMCHGYGNEGAPCDGHASFVIFVTCLCSVCCEVPLQPAIF